ncbi:hypothetical protein CRYUN_Cryun05aG0016900 [Craigia yunnanensis]
MSDWMEEISGHAERVREVDGDLLDIEYILHHGMASYSVFQGLVPSPFLLLHFLQGFLFISYIIQLFSLACSNIIILNGPVYVADITPKNLRGGFSSFVQAMTICSISVAYFVGSITYWCMALIGVIPCIIQVLCLFFVPESPRWLTKNGRDNEFKTSLQCLRGMTADISQEEAEIHDYTKNLQRSSEDKGLDLFSSKICLFSHYCDEHSRYTFNRYIWETASSNGFHCWLLPYRRVIPLAGSSKTEHKILNTPSRNCLFRILFSLYLLFPERYKMS